ncbi:hypothetical protein AYO38_10170 [bacterium SCGC AG-212-C10]|nr:hypothetical protein AYO38_10170 [bacterium SCGC AG-212-C10]
MIVDALDHLILAVPDLSAAAPFERLGLTLTPPARHHARGTENRAFFLKSGDGDAYIELLSAHDRAEAAESPDGPELLAKLDAGGGLVRLMLRSSNLEAAKARLSEEGIQAIRSSVDREDGTPICEVLRVLSPTAAGCPFALIAYPETPEERLARHRANGLLDHAFPVRRIDHVAVLVEDVDSATTFWTDVLGVPLVGEIVSSGATIRQLGAGDVTVELIGPTGPDSRFGGRPMGLISVAAFEVADLDQAVAEARSRGFTVPDPEVGVIPGTRRATISPSDMSGLAFQLIQYTG